MSDFLTNLAARSLDQTPAIRPRLVSLYEPLPPTEGMMAGAFFDQRDADREEFGESSASESPSLFSDRPPVSTTPPATAAQPSSAAPAYQSDQSIETPQSSHRPDETFRATEFVPDKSRPREPGTEQPRELSSTDFSAPERLRSDPVVPTAMIHSPHKETSPSLDLAPALSSKLTTEKPEANPEYEIHKDLRILLEGPVDQTMGEPRDPTSTTQPSFSPSQIAASPLSGTEEANRSSPHQVVHSVTIQRPATESPKRFVEVESPSDTSVQETASAEEGRPRTPSPAVHPVTIERIVPAEKSPPRFVSAEDLSLAGTSVQETASAEEGGLRAPSPAVHPVTIERIIPNAESPPWFGSAQDVSLTGTSVQETPSAKETRLQASSPAVRLVTIEGIVPAAELPRPHSFSPGESSFVQELLPSRTKVPTTTTIVVHPEISQASPAAETRVDSPMREPNVQVTIGRIEVRAIKVAEVQPKNDRAAQSTLMSLDDYLRQRAQGGKQ